MKLPFKNICTTLIFISVMARAQVGIGLANPDPSTVLDLYSTSKGLLMPRVQLLGINDTTTIPVTSSASSPDEGMLVYNISDAGVSPSNVIKDTFYIWTGTQWESIGEVSDVRAEINNKNITQIVFSGIPAVVSSAYTASAYSAWTPMNFSTEKIDTNNTHNAGTFTIPATGLYSFSGSAELNLSSNSGTLKSFGARIINVTTSTVLAASYFGTSAGGFQGSMPLYWMGTLPVGTQIQVQYRVRDNVSSTLSTNTNSNITLRKHF
ncbi:hypothetical protein HHL23_21585 [Chryseobacterium sp. RP-3-3]|uniref:C1q domain-containing protein n=1 Tax=Chryseobacterium antibioticum TaxID=2728847 RepID=A0A7Y0ARU5_9FLAO|nr:hypothetical protein [Chryseobacterium antibioticum]NML72356.1 hypothetical protein [Chryseobacterium antibioticum]